MLILTRKPGETVVIGDDVRITVLSVRGSQIKLGIDAPREVRVNREEVLERDLRGRPQVGAVGGERPPEERPWEAPARAGGASYHESRRPPLGPGRDARGPVRRGRRVSRSSEPVSHRHAGRGGPPRGRRRRDPGRGSEAA